MPMSPVCASILTCLHMLTGHLYQLGSRLNSWLAWGYLWPSAVSQGHTMSLHLLAWLARVVLAGLALRVFTVVLQHDAYTVSFRTGLLVLARIRVSETRQSPLSSSELLLVLQVFRVLGFHSQSTPVQVPRLCPAQCSISDGSLLIYIPPTVLKLWLHKSH